MGALVMLKHHQKLTDTFLVAPKKHSPRPRRGIHWGWGGGTSQDFAMHGGAWGDNPLDLGCILVFMEVDTLSMKCGPFSRI